MTKTERLMKAFENEKVDRVPVGFWFHLPEDMELDQECVDAHIDYFHRCNVDMVKIMCDGYFDYPNSIISQIKEPEDWFKMILWVRIIHLLPVR